MTSPNANRSLALSLIFIAVGMMMLAYASVPLYRIFCQTTGFGGIAEKTARVARVSGERRITVHFDANVNSALDWTFRAAQHEVSVRVGEETHVDYIARNRGGKAVTGTATFNITPVKAGAYFNKIQCFCFTRQTLDAYESRSMGVTFFIDPSINDSPDLADVNSITLSYTFFPAK